MKKSILISLALISFQSIAQNYSDSTYYLVDLNECSIGTYDAALIDTALNNYYSSETDSLKLSAIQLLIKKAIDNCVWVPYLDFLLVETTRLLEEKPNTYHQLKPAFFYAYNTKTYYTSAIGDFSETFELLRKGEQITSYLNDLNTAIHFKVLRGRYLKESGQNSEALSVISQIIDKPKGLTYKTLALAYKERAAIFISIGSFDDFFRNIETALELYRIDNNELEISRCLNEIAVAYSYQENHELSLKYHLESYESKRNSGATQLDLAVSLNNIAGEYTNLEKYDSATYYVDSCIVLSKKIKNLRVLGYAYNWKSRIVLNNTGNHEEAIFYSEQALATWREINFSQGISSGLSRLGDLLLKDGKYEAASAYYSEGLAIAESQNKYSDIVTNSHGLYLIYLQNKQFEKALNMFQLENQYADTLVELKGVKKAANFEFKYAYEKQKVIDDAEHDKLIAAEQAENKERKQRAYFLYGGLGFSLLLGGFIFNRFRVTRKQKGIIEKQKEQVDQAFDHLEEKNKEILDSINYAKRIQSAILPPDKAIKEHLKDAFILYKPKDIVAGDFYWIEPQGDKVYFAAADCTGHGVPGALVSVICNGALNRSVREYGLTETNEILDKSREIVIAEFEKSENVVKDGMDIALCSIERTTLSYSGANNPLWIIRNGATEIEEIKANKQPIGEFDKPLPYTSHKLELNQGDSIYIFSDGYVDQFGGEKGKKFKSKAFRALLLSIQDKSMEEQSVLIDQAFTDWMGQHEQVDDVCVIGLKI